MKTPRRAFACLATAFAVGTTALLGPATPATAATATCSIVPGQVTVGDRSTVVELDVDSSSPYWNVSLGTPRQWAAVTPNRDYRYITFNARNLKNSDAGPKQRDVTLVSHGTEESATCRAPFTILRGSKLSLAARKVTSGTQLTGTLKRITFGYAGATPWITSPWRNFTGQKVELQYRSGSEWITTATAKTQTDGTFKATTKLVEQQWRVIYAGSATTAASASSGIPTPAAPAPAGITCSVVPSSVTLYDQPKKVKFQVKSRLEHWGLNLLDANAGPDDGNPVETLSSGTQSSWIAGKVDGDASLYSSDASDVGNCKTSFTVLRGSRISLAAKTVTSGRQFSGSLKAVKFGWRTKPVWADEGGRPVWTAQAGRTVTIQYKAANGTWKNAATTTTQPDGTYRVTKKMGKHQWRAVYGGSSTTGARTSKAVTS